MKIKQITLQGYKRFTDLTVANLPETAKLVVLLGPNGCGKSSLFDAILVNARARYRGVAGGAEYHNKMLSTESEQRSFDPNAGSVKVEFHGNPPAPNNSEAWRKTVYVRSAYRNDPVIAVESFTRVGKATNHVSINRLIDNDAVVANNYQRLASWFFELGDKPDGYDRRMEIMEKIRQPMRRLFDNPSLVLSDLGNALVEGTFRFTKGKATGYKYENLSSGEKAAFDLVLDMIIKREEYNDTVFCIDEPETHIGMRLQVKLLDVLYELVPENCQLWIATHSIGIMRKAWELQKQLDKDSIVFLNFDDKNFDEKAELKPAEINRDLWRTIHSVALEDMAELVMPTTIYVCEGESSKRVDDAGCYNKIFQKNHPDVLFVAGGGKGNLSQLASAIQPIARKADVFTLRDRDRATEEYIRNAAKKRIKILRDGSIENYLLSDDVLCAFCKEQGCPEKGDALIKVKSEVANIKAAAYLVFQEAKKLARSEYNCGENQFDFLRNTLAPLITPETDTYKKLEREIFGETE